jgi:sugar lactone lactonase YvrE
MTVEVAGRPVRLVMDNISFPECPRWHDGALWFSDIHGHAIWRLPGGRDPQVAARIDDRVAGLGFLPDGDLLAVSMLDRRLIAIAKDGRQRLHADMAPLSKQFTNDMVVDAKGRAYVGSRNGGAPGTDNLILVDEQGRARTVDDRMTSPNGSVISPDGKHLFVAETQPGRLVRFTIASDGSLSERTVVVSLPGRHIDGLCQDGRGNFWGGGGDGGLHHFGPDGTLFHTTHFPGRMVAACWLDGVGKTLYLCTSSPKLIENLGFIGFDRTRDAQVSSDGRIEAVEVG